jgi:8-oxo-dGTP pyrophosphatase MutT (NUDIX family)
MRWTVHGERAIYSSAWVNLHLVDVEIPGGPRFEHHVIRMPQPAAGVVVHDPQRGILLLHRHRFITDTWGWEIPAGRIEAGEAPEAAAARECLEETGWEAANLLHLVTYRYANGVSDGTFWLYLAHGAHHRSDPTDPAESERIDWVPVAEVRRLVRDHQVADGLSLTALLWVFAHDLITAP